ncbi:RNA ligase/cyclic nucleotide phosphodiesterase [Nemania sp. FL0031]|nr:RNA ligase/cyclic nucleotide phosphodiesterase [Nemania sp. FL0031]
MAVAVVLGEIISNAQNNPNKIQEICQEHRRKRYETCENEFLGLDFQPLKVDNILRNLLYLPGYQDPRNNLCVFARATQSLSDTIAEIQQELRLLVPDIWLSPLPMLHMTVLEIVHSKTPADVESCVKTLGPCLAELTQLANKHPVRLVKPQLVFDTSAVAITFVPACQHEYTYLHLRRDLAKICEANGIDVASRYTTTSSHMTIARHIEINNLGNLTSRKAWASKIEDINERLRVRDGPYCQEWTIGIDSKLEIRKGTLWYGGGELVAIG